MSDLTRRSALVLGLLFGLVFAVGTGFMWYLQQPISYAVIFTLIVVSIQFALGPFIIELIFKIRWAVPSDISPEFDSWYRNSCDSAGIPVPRIGIIDDGNPNAFTYGRTPYDARIVVTSGLLQILTHDELKAVVAHEIGHVAHYDFIVMTVAQAIPLILYQLYVWSRRRGNNTSYAIAVSVGAYLVYLLSEYIVLFLSRIRELFADESSAQTTHDPNALSTALIKICYGLAKCQDKLAQEHWAEATGSKKDKKREKQHRPVTSASIAALGIANAGDARGFALSTSNAMGDFSEAAMANALQWEFTNPWAKWFQLFSSHPLTARRVHLMNETAKRMGIKPLYNLSITTSDHRQDISKFVREFLIYSLPFLSALVSVAVGISKIGIHSWFDLAPHALIGYGLGWFVKTACIYPSKDARPYTVEELVGKEINASPVKAVPCIIEGRIIGRGVPGLFWSDDLVIRDSTGFLMLQYRQPLGIFEFLFGWLKAGHYIGREARVYGWYRRAPSPYIEISHIRMKDNLGDNVRCYYMWGSYVIATLFVLIGVALLILL